MEREGSPGRGWRGRRAAPPPTSPDTADDIRRRAYQRYQRMRRKRLQQQLQRHRNQQRAKQHQQQQQQQQEQKQQQRQLQKQKSVNSRNRVVQHSHSFWNQQTRGHLARQGTSSSSSAAATAGTILTTISTTTTTTTSTTTEPPTKEFSVESARLSGRGYVSHRHNAKSPKHGYAGKDAVRRYLQGHNSRPVQVHETSSSSPFIPATRALDYLRGYRRPVSRSRASVKLVLPDQIPVISLDKPSLNMNKTISDRKDKNSAKSKVKGFSSLSSSDALDLSESEEKKISSSEATVNDAREATDFSEVDGSGSQSVDERVTQRKAQQKVTKKKIRAKRRRKDGLTKEERKRERLRRKRLRQQRRLQRRLERRKLRRKKKKLANADNDTPLQTKTSSSVEPTSKSDSQAKKGVKIEKDIRNQREQSKSVEEKDQGRGLTDGRIQCDRSVTGNRDIRHPGNLAGCGDNVQETTLPTRPKSTAITTAESVKEIQDSRTLQIAKTLKPVKASKVPDIVPGSSLSSDVTKIKGKPYLVQVGELTSGPVWNSMLSGESLSEENDDDSIDKSDREAEGRRSGEIPRNSGPQDPGRRSDWRQRPSVNRGQKSRSESEFSTAGAAQNSRGTKPLVIPSRRWSLSQEYWDNTNYSSTLRSSPAPSANSTSTVSASSSQTSFSHPTSGHTVVSTPQVQSAVTTSATTTVKDRDVTQKKRTRSRVSISSSARRWRERIKDRRRQEAYSKVPIRTSEKDENRNTKRRGSFSGSFAAAVNGESDTSTSTTESMSSTQNKGNGPEKKSPFLDHKTAYDFLSSQKWVVKGRGVQSERRRESNELNRFMSEGMCEIFNKHYVPTRIGGKCE